MSYASKRPCTAYYIFEYPIAVSDDRYFFVIKQRLGGKLITLTAHDLLHYRTDIMAQLSPSEVNKVYYYYGLEDANSAKRIKNTIKQHHVFQRQELRRVAEAACPARARELE